jgi:hypothetical protein
LPVMIDKRFALGTLALAMALLVAVTPIAQSTDSQPDKKRDSDTLVVPAGTEIRVEFTQPYGGSADVITGKVVTPVRVGWATAIPALSKVKMNVAAGFVDLASVTVGKVSYKVNTNAIELYTSATGSDSELGFVLREPVEIAR